MLDVYFLFPTIENMVSTPRGRQVLPWVTTFRLLAVMLMCALSFIPGKNVKFIISDRFSSFSSLDFLLRVFLKVRYSKASSTFVAATLDFVNSNQ